MGERIAVLGAGPMGLAVAYQLARDGHERNRVHEGVRDTGDEVGRSRTGGGHANSDATGHTGIPFGGENAALFVTRKDRADFFGFGESLMDRHRATTGISKNHIHALALKAFDKNLRSIHNFAPFRCSGGFRGGGFFGLHNVMENS